MNIIFFRLTEVSTKKGRETPSMRVMTVISTSIHYRGFYSLKVPLKNVAFIWRQMAAKFQHLLGAYGLK